MKKHVRKQKTVVKGIGVELDRRARLRMRRKLGLSYGESLRYEMNKNPKLATRYIRAAKPNLLRDLKRVANLLNKETTPGLRELLAPMMSPRRYSEKGIDDAASGLIGKLSGLQPEWRYSVRSKRVVFWLQFPETDHLGVIATALLSSDLSLLKWCPWCNDFFVDTDHRVEYHPDCFKESERDRAKKNRAEEKKARGTQAVQVPRASREFW